MLDGCGQSDQVAFVIGLDVWPLTSPELCRAVCVDNRGVVSWWGGRAAAAVSALPIDTVPRIAAVQTESMPAVPRKDFSDLYERMSGKGASASEGHPSLPVSLKGARW